MAEAILFDLDGVLIDSEALWDEVRRAFVQEHGGIWTAEAQTRMMGVRPDIWPRYMAEELRVPLTPTAIHAGVLEMLQERYRRDLPVIPGARSAVRELAREWPLAVASSSDRHLIELVLEQAELEECFTAVVSTEEVPRGKPAPDVYLKAAESLRVAPSSCAAVEDSEPGIRSAVAAGCGVIAIPNRDFPPSEATLGTADVVLPSIRQLDAAVVRLLATSDASRTL